MCLCVYVLTHARGVYFSVNMRECRGLSHVFVCMEHTHTIERKMKSQANTVARGRASAKRFDLHSKTER